MSTEASQLTRAAFDRFRQTHPGGKSAKAFKIWVAEGGKDKDGFVFKPKKQKKKKENKKKNEKKDLHIKKCTYIFKKGSKPTINIS